MLRKYAPLLLVAALLSLTLAVPRVASAAVVISRAELKGTQLRVDGSGAAPNAGITVDGATLGRADQNGRFSVQKDPFSSATCTITVGDGTTSAQATLSGCTPSAPPPSSGPAAPTPLAPAAGASVTEPFTLSWSAVGDPSGIAGYNWEIAASSAFSPVILPGSTDGATQDTVSGLPAGAYVWRVQAVSGNFVDGAWSSPRSLTVTGASASAPGTPTLDPPHGGTAFHPMESITFTWSAVAGAATYNLDAAQDPTFPVATRLHRDNIPDTTYSLILGDSIPQGTWYVRVTALDANRVAGLPSNTVTFTLSFDAPLPPPPTLLTPANGAAVTLPVTFTWTDVPNPQESGYLLEIADDPGFGSIEYINNQITGPHWTVTSLTAGTKYWHIASMQGDSAPGVPALTAWSATGSFVVPATATMGSLTLSDPTPFSGDTEIVTVQLTGPAPAGGAVVNLTSSDPTAAPLPATFTVGEGFAFAQFRFQVGQVTAATPVTLTATFGGAAASVAVTVAPPSLKEVVVPSTGTGGVLSQAIVMLNGLAPPGGAVVALGSDSPAASPPATVTIAPGAASATVVVPTSAVATDTVVTITATWQGQAVQAQTTLTPGLPPASLTLDPTSTTPPSVTMSTGTVRIAAPASRDAAFVLTSSDPTLASVNAGVTVPAGAVAANFFIFTRNIVATPTAVTIAVSGGGVTKSAVLTINPSAPPPSAPVLGGLALSPTSVVGGAGAQGTVTLSAAPSSPTVVSLASGDAAVAAVPASVTVAAGATTATFAVATTAVTATTGVTITASLGGATKSAALSVTAAPADRVAVQQAEYVVKDRVLSVQATGSNASATLRVYVTSTGELVGTLTNK
ncbi:MAG TPA: hypothetical protein VFW96_08700, partial [Thermomicrobiales bacterium]|nr:hypothetical protein [Thermomicrobiales bacterium]